jgi:hypothetical protein
MSDKIKVEENLHIYIEIWSWEGLENSVNKIRQKIADMEAKGFENVKIDIKLEYGCYEGEYTSYCARAEYERDMTAKEIEARDKRNLKAKETAAQAKKQKIEKEKKELARLKAKYEKV